MVQYGGGLQLQAATPLAGFTLVNGTPNIISLDSAQRRADAPRRVVHNADCHLRNDRWLD